MNTVAFCDTKPYDRDYFERAPEAGRLRRQFHEFRLATETAATAGGARSETKSVWRISLRTNLNLSLVVGVSFALQFWSHHNATLGRWLKTSTVPLADGLLLLAFGTIPLVVLEIVKRIRRPRVSV